MCRAPTSFSGRAPSGIVSPGTGTGTCTYLRCGSELSTHLHRPSRSRGSGRDRRADQSVADLATRRRGASPSLHHVHCPRLLATHRARVYQQAAAAIARAGFQAAARVFLLCRRFAFPCPNRVGLCCVHCCKAMHACQRSDILVLHFFIGGTGNYVSPSPSSRSFTRVSLLKLCLARIELQLVS